jgi:hypothetical protein
MGKTTKIYFFEKENFGLYFVIGVFIVIIVASIGKCHTEKEIIENMAFAKGLVTNCSSSTKPPSSTVEFEFRVNNQLIHSICTTKLPRDGLRERVVNKYFPVVYSSKTPDFNRILLTQEDRMDYGLTDAKTEEIMK